jgi:hypothetical protein
VEAWKSINKNVFLHPSLRLGIFGEKANTAKRSRRYRGRIHKGKKVGNSMHFYTRGALGKAEDTRFKKEK